MNLAGGRIPRILAVGTATRDVFMSIQISDFSLKFGEKQQVSKIEFATGGGAMNAAITFARQGLNTSFMGVIGQDAPADAILAELDANHINTSRLQIDERLATDYSTVLLLPNGERSIFAYHGASAEIYAENFQLQTNEFDWIYVANLAGRFDVLHQIFEEARAKNVKIAWNPSGAELAKVNEVKALLEDVDLLILNKDEAQILAAGTTGEELVYHCLNLVEAVVITDGVNGSWVSDGKTLVRAGLYEDVLVVDRTGAGDAFGAGFLAVWSQGATLSQSVLLASANSTAVVQQIGAQTGILELHQELHAMPMSEKAVADV